MARTYSNSPVLSKIKIGENTYYLKDGDARAILDAINADVYESLKLALGTVVAGGDNLVTAANIKAYVDEIAEIGFDVVVLQTLPTADAQSYATYHNNIVLIADASFTTGAYVEYVILRSGSKGAYTYAWERIGTTQLDLNGYVKDVAYTDATHTLTQTKNNNGVDETTTVHIFGDLADADTATGSTTLNTVDSASFTGATVSTSADYTPAGTITVAPFTQTDTAATLTKADYTPAGTITSVTVIDELGTQASKAADTWDAGALPSKAADTWDAGALPSLGTASTGTFTSEGIVASVGTGDDSETLIFTAALTATAVTAQGTFNQGSLPSFTEGAFDAGSLPSFTEGTFTPNVLPTTKTVTPTFTGTTATDVLVTGVNYDKATSAGATFTGTAATITSTGTAEGDVDLVQSAKTITITVNPD